MALSARLIANGSFAEKIKLPRSIPRNELFRVYDTTDFTRDKTVELCAHVHAVNKAAADSKKVAAHSRAIRIRGRHVYIFTQESDSSRDRRVIRSPESTINQAVTAAEHRTGAV